MGHTHHEIFSQEAAGYADKINHILALRERLKHTSLSEFTPNDLPALLRIMDHRSSDPTEEELNRIERKLDDLLCAP